MLKLRRDLPKQRLKDTMIILFVREKTSTTKFKTMIDWTKTFVTCDRLKLVYKEHF